MTSTTYTTRVPAGVSAGGQFAASARSESAVELGGSGIETLVRRGVLSPGARGMDPREAIDQYVESTGAPFVERVALLREVGLSPRFAIGDLLPREKLTRADLEAVDPFRAEVDLVDGVDEFRVWRRPQQVRGRWRVDLGDTFGTAAGVVYADDGVEVDVAAHDEDERCSRCGGDLGDGAGYDGHCGDCADANEPDEDDGPDAHQGVGEGQLPGSVLCACGNEFASENAWREHATNR